MVTVLSAKKSEGTKTANETNFPKHHSASNDDLVNFANKIDNIKNEGWRRQVRKEVQGR